MSEYPKFENAPKGLYRHYKGNYYRVICMSVHTETGEELVIYEDVDITGKIWARPLSMWNEIVVVNGVKLRRFQKQSKSGLKQE